jgi:hypothetical protein
MVLAVIALVKIENNKGRLRGKALAFSAIIISGIATIIASTLVTLWTLDAEPLPRQYSITDLRSAPAKHAQTYQLRKTLADPREEDANAAIAIGLSSEDVNSIWSIHKIIADANYWEISHTITANAHEIERVWKKTQKGRTTIEMLSECDEIADLVTPDMNLPDERLFAPSLLKLGFVYHSYVLLLADKGDYECAVEELIKFDSVFRKLSLNARDVMSKFICFWGIKTNIMVANAIVNDPHTKKASLERLAEHFRALTDDELALRNVILFQWLEGKLLWKTIYDRDEVRRYQKGWKWNSTMRLYHNFWTEQLRLVGELKPGEGFISVWPRIYGDWFPSAIGKSAHDVPLYYIGYNPGPAALFCATTPSFQGRYNEKKKMKALDNLFQVILAHRLGSDISQLDITVRGDGDKCVLDSAGGRMSFIGPDGKIGTEDDVTLPINAELLGFPPQTARQKRSSFNE